MRYLILAFLLMGCATSDHVISNGTKDNLSHEMEHLIEMNCQEWR